MQVPRVDVDKVENMQAALTSEKSLIELIISDAESKAGFYKYDQILSDSFGDIAVALNGVHLLIIGIPAIIIPALLNAIPEDDLG